MTSQITVLSPLSFTGSPLQFYVDYMNSGNVSAYGPGLIHGTVNKPAVFTVNTKDAGEGMYISCHMSPDTSHHRLKREG